jgi:hypothetical protein
MALHLGKTKRPPRPPVDTDVEGELGYFGLASWWSAMFTELQRAHIEEVFQSPNLPAGSRPLTTGRKRLGFRSAATLLTAVAGALRSESDDRTVAMEILHKAETRAKAEDDVIGLHFTYQGVIHQYCKWRDRLPEALDLIFGACYKQIAIAPEAAKTLHDRHPQAPLPIHAGFQLMAVLLDKEEAYEKAIEICKQARFQGWSGNWTWRIGCLAKKLGQRGDPVRQISSSGLGPI